MPLNNPFSAQQPMWRCYDVNEISTTFLLKIFSITSHFSLHGSESKVIKIFHTSLHIFHSPRPPTTSLTSSHTSLSSIANLPLFLESKELNTSRPWEYIHVPKCFPLRISENVFWSLFKCYYLRNILCPHASTFYHPFPPFSVYYLSLSADILLICFIHCYIPTL